MKRSAWLGLMAVVVSMAGCTGDTTAPVGPEVSEARSNSSTYIRSTIIGPTALDVDVTCTWYVQVHNGTPPYTYSWSPSGLVDAGGGNTSSSWTGSRSPDQWMAFLSVYVTDANGNSGWSAPFTVEESWDRPRNCDLAPLM